MQGSRQGRPVRDLAILLVSFNLFHPYRHFNVHEELL